jgi:hypothetical protein
MSLFYTSKKDSVDSLIPEQLTELNSAIKEADSNKTITWSEFKNELMEWRKIASN